MKFRKSLDFGLYSIEANASSHHVTHPWSSCLLACCAIVSCWVITCWDYHRAGLLTLGWHHSSTGEFFHPHFCTSNETNDYTRHACSRFQMWTEFFLFLISILGSDIVMSNTLCVTLGVEDWWCWNWPSSSRCDFFDCIFRRSWYFVFSHDSKVSTPSTCEDFLLGANQIFLFHSHTFFLIFQSGW